MREKLNLFFCALTVSVHLFRSLSPGERSVIRFSLVVYIFTWSNGRVVVVGGSAAVAAVSIAVFFFILHRLHKFFSTAVNVHDSSLFTFQRDWRTFSLHFPVWFRFYLPLPCDRSFSGRFICLSPSFIFRFWLIHVFFSPMSWFFIHSINAFVSALRVERFSCSNFKQDMTMQYLCMWRCDCLARLLAKRDMDRNVTNKPL